MVATKKKRPVRKTTGKVTKINAKKPVAKKEVSGKRGPKKIKSVKAPLKKSATAKKTSMKPAATKAPQGFVEELLAEALKVLDDRQAEEIVTIPLVGRSSVADYLIIASGRAGRQVAALADYLREAFFKLGLRKIRIEGMGEANWVLVDAGDIVIHLFRPEVRRYYDLDGIWTSKSTKQ